METRVESTPSSRAQRRGLSDDLISHVARYLRDLEVVSLCSAAPAWIAVLRSDRVWARRNHTRWRNGSAYSSDDDVLLRLHGDRVDAAERAISIAERPGRESCGEAFAFFLRRCQCDWTTVVRVLQMSAYAMRAANVSRELSPLRGGTVVEIHSLERAVQYNGCTGVVLIDSLLSEPLADERTRVIVLPSADCIMVRAGNIRLSTGTFGSNAHPAAAAADDVSDGEVNFDAFRRTVWIQIVERGADSIDALLALQRKARDPGARCVVSHALADIKTNLATAQWRALLDDPARLDRLEEGALILSQWSSPNTDVAQIQTALANLTRKAADTLPSFLEHEPERCSVGARISAVNAAFTAEGYRGCAGASYYEPKNSFLHAVITTRTGIPISLSIIWAAVAKRLGLSAHVLAAMPAHVIVRVDAQPVSGGVLDDDDDDASSSSASSSSSSSPQRATFIDPFNDFNVMNFEELSNFCISLIRYRPMPEQLCDFVRITEPQQVYKRLLRNVIAIWKRDLAVLTQQERSNQVFQTELNMWGACMQYAELSKPVEEAEMTLTLAKLQLKKDAKLYGTPTHFLP